MPLTRQIKERRKRINVFVEPSRLALHVYVKKIIILLIQTNEKKIGKTRHRNTSSLQNAISFFSSILPGVFLITVLRLK